ncbi:MULTISPECIES: hypothetical protein [Gammaproteobacteria]|jgi:hypothetical protein|uniref:hypothetical protein n=1 Tax=Gammaproteobacteria TaxID=1236 RepID=UPI0005B35C8A|nr:MULTISPECIES: hypothetical protein [Gammaproteobacteria]KJS69466.1 MAG: hypothetical protein JL55_33485 [[Pseudomonas] sp. BICA1-14]MAL90595.1 hypothetical protein [Pseudomonas sp.]MBP24167.1 hypothetical protein [Methylophaga sp.]|tara:strand:+ start:6488 stop:6961 length:474 start_codon:yes stop_codon:yes gene_type:complete
MAPSNQKNSPFGRYREYVLHLEQAGRKFPVNQFGDVNFSRIANECGNRRQWFSESANKIFTERGETLERIIQADIRRIGSEFVTPKDPESALIDLADSKGREASILRSLLDQKSKENDLLRQQVERLTVEIRALQGSVSELSSRQEMMLDSGRVFTL